MSRLPFRPGPGPARPIPKLIFEGIDTNSPEAAHLAKVFGPTIRQFYLSQAQRHDAGTVPQTLGQRQFGDALRMRYMNQNGQETVYVKVAPQLRRQARQRVQGFWDWALVEITAPATPYTYGEEMGGATIYPALVAGARLASPTNPNVDEVHTASSGELASNSPNPVLYFAYPNGTEIVTDKLQQSLLVDMRGMGNIPLVSIKLYAKLATMDDDIVPTIIGKTFRAELHVDTLDYPNFPDWGTGDVEVLPSWWDDVRQWYPGFWPDFIPQPPPFAGEDPIGHYGGLSRVEVEQFILDNYTILNTAPTPFGDYGIGYIEYEDFIEGAPLPTWIRGRAFWLPDRHGVLTPVEVTAEATLRGRMFMTDPGLWAWSEYIPNVIMEGTNSGVWASPDMELVTTAELRPTTSVTTIPAVDEDDWIGMRYLGEVRLDRQAGGVSFKPA